MTASSYHFKLAKTPEEVSAYFALRHAIFVEEQQVFQSSDVDDLDAIAYPIIALKEDTSVATAPKPTNTLTLPLAHHPVLRCSQQETVQMPLALGVVRIYEAEPRLWYGGRLGVHLDYRRAGRIGKGLIQKAVTTANTWGCDRFLATVQLQNVRFFQRLHWNSLSELTICGLPHHLMEADLAYYPPGNECRPALSTAMREAS